MKKFWLSEKNDFPRWWTDATNAKKVTWEEFRDFYNRMWKVYELEDALVFFEKVGNNANVHFSLIRGGKIELDRLREIRDEVLCSVRMIFGWVSRRNRGLRKMLESLGFQWDGLTMYHGESHGKVQEYLCYTYVRKTLAPKGKDLILST